MEGSQIFRAAVPNDYEAICSLIASEDEFRLIYPRGRYPLTVSQIQRRVNKVLEPTVMEVDGKIVGFCALYNYKASRYVFFTDLLVDPAQRQLGIGTRLIVHMAGLAFSKYEVPQIRVGVFSENVSVLLGATRMGFKPYAIKQRIDRDGNRRARLLLRVNQDSFEP